MLIILSKDGKVLNNYGTNSLFPNGEIPGVDLNEEEIAIRIHDSSDFAKQILKAYDYELLLNGDNELTDVIVHKTLEQFQYEQPTPIPEPSEIEALTNYALDVDMRLVIIEMGLI